MTRLTRRRVVAGAALLACVPAGYRHLFAPALAADAAARRILIEARKFEFAPKEIRVAKGERITLVLTAPDFVHGLSLPDFNVRADGIPGKTIEVTFVAQRAGKFIYLCDNFCGEDHDKMSGWLIVT